LPWSYKVIAPTDEGGEIVNNDGGQVVQQLGYVSASTCASRPMTASSIQRVRQTRGFNWTDPGLTNYTWNVLPESIPTRDGEGTGLGQVVGQTV
jgi:hypothetical protein